MLHSIIGYILAFLLICYPLYGLLTTFIPINSIMIKFYYRNIYPFILENFTSFNKYSPKIPKGWRQIRLGEVIPNDRPVYYHKMISLYNSPIYWRNTEHIFENNERCGEYLKSSVKIIISKQKPPRYKIF